MEHGMVSIWSYGVQCKPYCGYYSPTADVQGAILPTVVLVRTYRVLVMPTARLGAVRLLGWPEPVNQLPAQSCPERL
jgi:hypothetical protein